jgi:hypothetical protein
LPRVLRPFDRVRQQNGEQCEEEKNRAVEKVSDPG